MSKHEKIPTIDKSDRLSKWRNERFLRSENDKSLRLMAKALRQKTDEEKTALRKQQTAKALLPTPAEQFEHEEQILQQRRSRSGRAVFDFALCAVLPVVLAAVYLTNYATPLFTSEAVVSISKGASAGTADTAGLLNSLSKPNTLQDAFVANAYIQSRDMLNHLEGQHQIVERWSSKDIDPLRRLRNFPFLGWTAEGQVHRFVESHVDIQTGLLTVQVRDPDPETSVEIANTILAQSQNQLTGLSNQQFATHIASAEESVEQAKQDLVAAQDMLAVSQVQSGEADPRARVDAIYAAVRQLEDNIRVLEEDVQRSEISGRGESFLALQTKELITAKKAEIEALRGSLVSGTPQAPSLNTIVLEYDRAQLGVRIAEEALTTAFSNLAAVTQSAANERSRLQVIVPPTVSTVPTNQGGLSQLIFIAVCGLAAFSCLRLLGGRRLA